MSCCARQSDSEFDSRRGRCKVRSLFQWLGHWVFWDAWMQWSLRMIHCLWMYCLCCFATRLRQNHFNRTLFCLSCHLFTESAALNNICTERFIVCTKDGPFSWFQHHIHCMQSVAWNNIYNILKNENKMWCLIQCVPCCFFVIKCQID